MCYRKLALLLLWALALPSFGDVVIDFGDGLAGEGGIFTLLGGVHAKGENIPIGRVIVSGAPLANGLKIVTGDCTDASGLFGSSGCLNFNTQTNTLTITGAIPSLGIANTTLLTGSFVSWTADADGIHNAKGPDYKAAALLTKLGLPLDQQFKYFGFSLTTDQQNPTTVISTDIRNTAVPDGSSTLILLGMGLIGVALARRFV